MRQDQGKRTSIIAIGSLLCATTVIACVFLFALTLNGQLVTYCIRLSYAAFFSGLAAILVITVRRRKTKGYLCAALAVIIGFPAVYMHEGFKGYAKVRERRRREWSGLYNLELLGKELVSYAEDNDGRLPVARKWCDLLMEHNKNLIAENFKHPQPKEWAHLLHFEGECQFAFNRNLGGMRLADIPSDVVLLLEADGPWNLSGTEEVLQTRYREKGYIGILFVDQSTADYWYYMKAVRKFSEDGKHMYYVEPRWKYTDNP